MHGQQQYLCSSKSEVENCFHSKIKLKIMSALTISKCIMKFSSKVHVFELGSLFYYSAFFCSTFFSLKKKCRENEKKTVFATIAFTSAIKGPCVGLLYFFNFYCIKLFYLKNARTC